MTNISISKTVAIAALLAGSAVVAWWLLAPSNHEVTEDAYVEGNVVQVTPQLNGSVTAIAADNTDYVQAGQVLVQLNGVDAQLALARAEAQLAKTVRQVRAQFASSGQGRAAIVLRRADVARAETDLARRSSLAGSGAVSGEDISHAEDALRTARAALTVAEQQSLSASALTDQTSVAGHPDVLAASAQLRDAYVAAHRTTLRAPVSGIVTRRTVQLGQRVGAGTALMSIVPPEQMWVSANFKESQLHGIRIGQPVELRADVYGKSVRYHGRVAGLDAGTGNAFSLLPAQNATGNWIKVVQRVPVRIALDPKQLIGSPLRVGLSMEVSIDVAGKEGRMLADGSAKPVLAQTEVFSALDRGADDEVRRVIAANGGRGRNVTLGASSSQAGVKPAVAQAAGTVTH